MDLVSIIMPVYNADNYVDNAIRSVLNQTYSEWELIIINDGSTDNSEERIKNHLDKRISYFKQKNKGVSSARNHGFSKSKGRYVLFLDADDHLPPVSLESRIDYFNKNRDIDFVDGGVKLMDARLESVKKEWIPGFKGNPLKDLIRLQGNSFFGPSWLIKRKIIDQNFDTELTHGEDLLFYMHLARNGGKYDFIKEPVLFYRDTPSSAMKKLKDLEKGYRYIANQIKKWDEVDTKSKLIYNWRWRRFMILSYLRKGSYLDAIKAIF